MVSDCAPLLAPSVVGVRLDEQRVEAAGLLQRVQLVVAGPVEEGAVGVDQLVEPIDQHADRQPVEDRTLIGGGRPQRRRFSLRLAALLGSRPFGAAAVSRRKSRLRRLGWRRASSSCSGLSLGPRRRAVRRFASSLNALRSTGVSVGTSSAGGAAGNGTTFTDGGTAASAGTLVAEHRRLDARRRSASAARRVCDQFVDARDIAANAEAAVAAEVAVAVEHRQAGQFDRQPRVASVDREGDGDAAPGVARGEGAGDLAFGIEPQRRRRYRSTAGRARRRFAVRSAS